MSNLVSNPLKKYYFTFGFGQKHENGYTMIEAETYGEARDKMFEMFGSVWAFQYDSSAAAGVEEFNLHYVNHPIDEKN